MTAHSPNSSLPLGIRDLGVGLSFGLRLFNIVLQQSNKLLTPYRKRVHIFKRTELQSERGGLQEDAQYCRQHKQIPLQEDRGAKQEQWRGFYPCDPSAIFLCPQGRRGCRTPETGKWPLHASKNTVCTHGPHLCPGRPASTSA